jgi:hypothetical protein
VLRDHFLAFDDYLKADSTTLKEGEYDRTGDQLCERLAAADLLGVFVVLEDQGGTTGTFSLKLEHSGDGIDFVDKSDDVTILDSEVWTANGTTVLRGSDAGTVPTLGFARLVLWGEGPTASHLRVKVYVALRDEDLIAVQAPDKPKEKGYQPTLAQQHNASMHEYGPQGVRLTQKPAPEAD